MNCAVVTIGGGKRRVKKRALSGPQIFVANVGNGCSTQAGTDVIFPNPGSDVTRSGSRQAGPVGTCNGQSYTGGGVTGGTGGTGTTGTTGGKTSILSTKAPIATKPVTVIPNPVLTMISGVVTYTLITSGNTAVTTIGNDRQDGTINMPIESSSSHDDSDHHRALKQTLISY